MKDSLVDRLRGQYSSGPDNVYGTRSFADFVPPISLEAANRIEELESALRDILEQVSDNKTIYFLIERVLRDKQ